jgi:hypothetical protein
VSPEDNAAGGSAPPQSGGTYADEDLNLHFSKKWHMATVVVYAAVAVCVVYLGFSLVNQRINYAFEDRLADPNVPYEELEQFCVDGDWGGGVTTYLEAALRYQPSPTARLRAARLIELFVKQRAVENVGFDPTEFAEREAWAEPTSSSVRAGFATDFSRELDLEPVSFALTDDSAEVRAVAKRILRITGTDAKHHQQRLLHNRLMETKVLTPLREGRAPEIEIEELAGRFDNVVPFLIGTLLPKELGGAGRPNERDQEGLECQRRAMDLLVRITNAKQATSTQRKVISVFGRRNTNLLVIALADPDDKISNDARLVLRRPSKGRLVTDDFLLELRDKVRAAKSWPERFQASREATEEIDDREGRRDTGMSEILEEMDREISGDRPAADQPKSD